MQFKHAGLVAAWIAAGCTEMSELAVVEQPDTPRCGWQCTGNSPEIDHYGFHELNLDGLPNAEGFALAGNGSHVQIWRHGVPSNLLMFNGRLKGSNGLAQPWGGQALVGAELRVTHHGLLRYRIAIERVREIPYALGPTNVMLEAYVLKWLGVGAPYDSAVNLCSSPVMPRHHDRGELLGMEEDETVLFQGDRINANAKTIAHEVDPAWFNLGCSRHALAKLHLTGNSAMARGADALVTRPDRQATLKMLVADYCGDGTPFTVAGEPLVWRSDLGGYARAPQTLEARWTEAGASCLSEPRMLVTALPEAQARFPDIEAAISAVCTRPPPCSNSNVDDMDGHERMSANP